MLFFFMICWFKILEIDNVFGFLDDMFFDFWELFFLRLFFLKLFNLNLIFVVLGGFFDSVIVVVIFNNMVSGF